VSSSGSDLFLSRRLEDILIYVKKAENLVVDVNPDFKKDLLKKLEKKTVIPSGPCSV